MGTEKRLLIKRQWHTFVRPEFLFATVTLVAGLCMVFATGPFQAPDESNHFYRAYQLSEGQIFGAKVAGESGGFVPDDLVRTASIFDKIRFRRNLKIDRRATLDLANKPFDPVNRHFVEFINTVITFPLCHLPQSIGVGIGRLCGSSVLGMMYAGRIVNLLCWVGLVFFAIRVTPVFKWVIVLIAVMPMTLFLAASLSADAMINACAIWLITMVLYARYAGDKSFGSGKRVLLGFLCMAISAMKLVYFPIVGLVLLIPANTFNNKKNKIWYCSAIFTVSCVAVFLWGIEVKRIYTDAYELDKSYRFNAQAQLSFILGDPWRFACIFFNTLGSQLAKIARRFIGVLGWLDTPLPKWIYYTYIPALTATAMFDHEDEKNSFIVGERIALFMICCVSFVILAVAQYLVWDKVGAPLIRNIQGRYLVPFSIPALLILHNTMLPTPGKRVAVVLVSIYILLVVSVTCVTVYGRYWG
jgi:uncharacterized membrane protein